MNWGKTAGKDDGQMPKGFFDNHAFKYGFFAVVVWLVYMLAFYIASSGIKTVIG